MNEHFITPNFNLPDYCNELSSAEDKIEKIKIRFKKCQDENIITNIEYTALYEETTKVLDYVGRLSIPAFNVEDELKEQYFQQFRHTPALAKKLWLEHFQSIHHPYNLLKNRCFKLLEDYDELYLSIHKNYPPNWWNK